MSAATRLSIYNDALLYCGERALSALTDNVETRRLLDQVWNNNGVRYCLERGQWYFAMRSIQIDYDPAIDPGFGYQYGFDKPSDWVLTSALCSDEYFNSPLTRYTDEAGYWYSDVTPLYVRYVSDDALYGTNYARWPETFKEYVAIYFASKVILKITQSQEKFQEVMALLGMKLLEAKNNNTMAGPTKFTPAGSWVSARARYGGRRDGGNNGSPLIG